MYHNFLIRLLADARLGCFDVLAIVNTAIVNIGVRVSLSHISNFNSGIVDNLVFNSLHFSFIFYLTTFLYNFANIRRNPMLLPEWPSTSNRLKKNARISFFFNFYFYFILLYNTVLVLPYIDMNPPRVYMRSQT